MESPWEKIGAAFGEAPAKWSLYAALATFAIYVFGYLAIRFQLMALGIGTDLELLDERYLFEGAKFMVYIVSTVPVAVLFALLLAAPGWLALRRSPSVRARLARWWVDPTGPLVAGIVFSVLMIQCVMKQCFLFDNLLLREGLPWPPWFASILIAPNALAAQVYFMLLIAGIAVVVGLSLPLRYWSTATPAHRALGGLLIFLIGVQVLLLPVNYGILASTRDMPRTLPGPESADVPPGSTAWLIWEGKSGVTFLVHDRANARKALLTVPRDQVKRIEIVAYDPFPVLKGPLLASTPPAPQNSGTPRSPDRPPPREPFWKVLAAVFGLNASPKQQRPVPPSEVRGDIILTSVDGGHRRQLTRDGNHRSPIFLPGDEAVLALRGDRLVQINAADGKSEEIASLPGAIKLIGIDPADAKGVFVLVKDETEPVKRFDLVSKRLEAIPLDPRSRDDETMLAFIRGEDHIYGEVKLRVDEKSDSLEEWTDVVVIRPGAEIKTLTEGAGVSSRQPALGHKKKLITYVKISKSSR
jgi:hypothetical protein